MKSSVERDKASNDVWRAERRCQSDDVNIVKLATEFHVVKSFPVIPLPRCSRHLALSARLGKQELSDPLLRNLYALDED